MSRKEPFMADRRSHAGPETDPAGLPPGRNAPGPHGSPANASGSARPDGPTVGGWLTRLPSLVLLAAAASLGLGVARTPLWDEDEPRFAAIARTMAETGDWIVPTFNGELAVDKPVLMHWAMAAATLVCGDSEIALRWPAVLATLLTAVALLRAGSRWFADGAGAVAALAFVGCLLVGIEAHAATPDAILTCLTTWATILAAEPCLAALALPRDAAARPSWPRLSLLRAAAVGGLMGLAVLCKGPIGVIGPLAVLLGWLGWLAFERRPVHTAGMFLANGLGAGWQACRTLRPVVMVTALLTVAAPWYVAVSLRTGGEWPRGFFLVHNVGRFVAPMEKHGGSVFLHPLEFLVGFYPWSCFLPLALVIAAWRVVRRADPPAHRAALLLVLVWLAVWIGGFSCSATKLPNYVLPAYPAAALVVAAVAMAAVRAGRWAHPGWMAAGTACLALGGFVTAAVIIVAERFGLSGAAPAALVGIVPVLGAAVIWSARHDPLRAVTALAATGLLFTGLAVGPAAARLSGANVLPDLVEQAHRHAGGRARLGTFTQLTPNVVYYARGTVRQWQAHDAAQAAAFLASGTDACVLVRADDLPALEAALAPGIGVIGRARPLFRDHDFLLVGSRGRGPVDTALAPAQETPPR
jgi:4-amino-4-deoxy-L-arabinose transferase-like glycosyltransferase